MSGTDNRFVFNLSDVSLHRQGHSYSVYIYLLYRQTHVWTHVCMHRAALVCSIVFMRKKVKQFVGKSLILFKHYNTARLYTNQLRVISKCKSCPQKHPKSIFIQRKKLQNTKTIPRQYLIWSN